VIVPVLNNREGTLILHFFPDAITLTLADCRKEIGSFPMPPRTLSFMAFWLRECEKDRFFSKKGRSPHTPRQKNHFQPNTQRSTRQSYNQPHDNFAGGVK